MSSTLIMHVDPARKTGLSPAQLRDMLVNPRTETHVPIAHSLVRDMVAERIKSVGLEIVNEQIATSTPKEIEIDGSLVSVDQKAFGTFDVRGLDYAIDSTAAVGLSVGWRNSMNKQLPAAVVVGSRVFVCDNLCFSGEIMLKRRHTKNILDDLPTLIEMAFGRIEPLANRQFALYERLREIEISDDVAVAAIAQACEMSGKAFLASKNVLPLFNFYRHDFATDAEHAAGIVYNRDQHGHGTAWALWNAGTAFAKQFLARSFVDASPVLLAWNHVIGSRFAADLLPSEKTSMAVTAADLAAAATIAPAAEQDDEDTILAPADETHQEADADDQADTLYDPADEDDVIGGFDPDEYEEMG